MQNDSVLIEKYSNIARIRFNRPEKGNVVNEENLGALYAHLKDAESDGNVRAIVIEGSEGVFCRGMDFSNLLKHEGLQIDEAFHEPYLKVVKAIRNNSKPVIAAIDGDVLAGGMGIALACDIVLATKRSSFGLSEVLFGIIPAYVFPFLLERMSFKKARYMVLSSKKFSAGEALSLNVIDEVYEDDALEKALTKHLKRILSSSPKALAVVKTYSDKIKEEDIDKALKSASGQLTELLNVSENVSAIKEFMEGGKAPWMVRYKKAKNDV